MAAPRGSRSASLLSYFHSSKQSAAVSEVGEEQPSVFLCNFFQRNLIPPLMVGLVTVFLGPVKISGSSPRDNHYKKLVLSTEKVQSSFASKDLQAERVTEVIRGPGVFSDRDKLGRTHECSV